MTSKPTASDGPPKKPWQRPPPAAESSSSDDEGFGFGSMLSALDDKEKPEALLDSFDLQGVASLIKAGTRNIIVMCGAGISVSAGIPDFRTPGTGLYDNLQKYNLPHPTAVFEMNFFRKNPRPFFTLAKELYPGHYLPTPTHYFVRMLHDKGLLRRCFTQNIDSLETLAGLPADRVVAAHGNFDSARCIDCKGAVDTEEVKASVMRGEVCECKACGGLVKPDIVFFGENLPARFFRQSQEDFPACELLIVMGTSLVVHPFAGLVDRVPRDAPRCLVNRERVGEMDPELVAMAGGRPTKGFVFPPSEWAYRDALYEGNCDDGCLELARLLGWEADLRALMEGHRRELEDRIAATKARERAESDDSDKTDS